MRSVASGPSSAWLEAVPAAAHLRLSNAAFLAAARHRLGLAMPLMAAAPACDCGHEDAASPDHAHVCNATKGLRTSRHDQQVNAWRRVLQRAGCSSCREPTYRTVAARAAANAAGLRRGDIFATMPDGRLLALDVVVVHPWASSYAAGASRTNGKAARVAAARKRTEFATIGEGAGGFDFVPIAVETGGRLGVDALRLLSELGDVAAASNSRLSKAAFVRRALAELACSLCRGNAGVCASSMSRLLRVAESAVQTGEEVAMKE